MNLHFIDGGKVGGTITSQDGAGSSAQGVTGSWKVDAAGSGTVTLTEGAAPYRVWEARMQGARLSGTRLDGSAVAVPFSVSKN